MPSNCISGSLATASSNTASGPDRWLILSLPPFQSLSFSQLMSTFSIPSAWLKPRQFSVPLPSDIHSGESSGPGFACSENHVVLGSKSHVYIYSLRSFDLLHTIEPGELSDWDSIRILGRFLVVTCQSPGCSDHSGEVSDWSLYIWDLPGGQHVGNVDYRGTMFDLGRRISVPLSERVEIEDNGNLVGQDWPRDPLLIIHSRGSTELRVHMLRHADAEGSEGHVERRHRPLHLLPAIPVSSSCDILCLASIGRTAIAGGNDASVRVLDIITGECRWVRLCHTDAGKWYVLSRFSELV